MDFVDLFKLKFIFLVVVYVICGAWSVPLNPRQFFYAWNTCPREFHSLHNTCGEDFVQFMGNLEQRSMEQPDFIDPSRCLDGKFVAINEVDFIVIGAGLAGSMVAGRLSEVRDWEVFVLEEGDAAPSAMHIPSMYFNYLKNPKYDYGYQLLPQKNACLNNNGICVYPRGKVMGGTAAIHGMMYMRGNRADYDILKDDGIEGWSYDDVFPYFLKSEDNKDINRQDLGIEPDKHATGGPFTISRFVDQPPFAFDLLNSYQELGYNINLDLNGASQRGFMIAQATNRNGSRLNSARAYLYDNINTRSNLYVQPNSKVLKILINPQTMVAEGVLYEHKGTQIVVRARKEVILSAGAIASPQLLMLSGVGQQQHLDEVGIAVVKHLPGVGQNLNNHVSTEIFFRIGGEGNDQQLNEKSAEEYFNFRTGPMTSTGLSQVTGFLWADFTSNEPRPDLQIFHAGFMANCSRTGSMGESIPGVDHRMFSVSPTVLNARSMGWVKLRNRYPESAPLIWGNILGEKHDIDMLLAGIRAVLRLPSTPSMAKHQVTLDQTVMSGCENLAGRDDEAYWRCYMAHKTNPENHQTGTCKMGAATDSMAVLDSKLRVYGIQNLRVADASVFPRSPSSNLQGPTMMVAERAADFIKETWKTPFLTYW